MTWHAISRIPWVPTANRATNLFISSLGLEPKETVLSSRSSMGEHSVFALLSLSGSNKRAKNGFGNAVYKGVGVLLLRDVVEKGV